MDIILDLNFIFGETIQMIFFFKSLAVYIERNLRTSKYTGIKFVTGNAVQDQLVYIIIYFNSQLNLCNRKQAVH